MAVKQKFPLLKPLFLVLAVLAVGTFGYYFLLSGWSLLDGLYMTLITIATIGYGETHELDAKGRVFTIFLIVLSVGVAATALAQLNAFFVEARLGNFIGRKRMQSMIKKLSGHVVVCGFGGIGQGIGVKLKEQGISFVVVEEDEALSAQAEMLGFLVVKGSPSLDSSLLAAGLERAASLVVAVPDFTTNLVVSMACREINPSIHIVACGEDRALEERLRRAGADEIAYPIRLGAERIAHLVLKRMGKAPESLPETGAASPLGYRLKLLRHYGDSEISVGEAVAKNGAIQAVALVRESGQRLERPADDLKLEQGDSLLIVVGEGKKDRGEGRAAPLRWTDDLGVGVPAIDEEHRKLLALLNDLGQGIADGSEPEIVGSAFDRLVDYTLVHFSHEEALLKKHGYPDMEAHVAEHRKLAEEVMELSANKATLTMDTVTGFLSSWLKNHIIDSDGRVGRYLRDNNLIT